MIKIRLDELLAERKVSLYEVAKATEIEYTTLHRYKTGKTQGVQLLHVEKLCKYFQIAPDSLFKITHQRQAKIREKKD
jgi:putative transcriptional regulator